MSEQPIVICPYCVDDEYCDCPRDADAKCLICGILLCASHISVHLKIEHCCETKV